jgi:hypothetical protein
MRRNESEHTVEFERAPTGIDLRFSVEEATMLIRAIAAAKLKAASTEDHDDLELLRCRICDRMSQSQQQPSGASARVLSSAGRIRVWHEPEGASAA